MLLRKRCEWKDITLLSMATGGDQNSSLCPGEDGAVGGRLPVTCDPCAWSKRTTAATVVCPNCDVNLCGDCCQGHRIHVPGEHIFVSIQSGIVKHCTVDLRGLDRCSDHGRVFVGLPFTASQYCFGMVLPVWSFPAFFLCMRTGRAHSSFGWFRYYNVNYRTFPRR